MPLLPSKNWMSAARSSPAQPGAMGMGVASSLSSGARATNSSTPVGPSRPGRQCVFSVRRENVFVWGTLWRHTPSCCPWLPCVSPGLASALLCSELDSIPGQPSMLASHWAQERLLLERERGRQTFLPCSLPASLPWLPLLSSQDNSLPPLPIWLLHPNLCKQSPYKMFQANPPNVPFLSCQGHD